MNYSGRRYLNPRQFLDCAKSLHLDSGSKMLSPAVLEFLEKVGLLAPVARIRFPAEIIRRWHKDAYPRAEVIEPIEGDADRYESACALRLALRRYTYPISEQHPLDNPDLPGGQFISRAFPRESFRAWDASRVAVALDSGIELLESDVHETYYHAWQVFPLATVLRSGASLLYDLDDAAVAKALWTDLGSLPPGRFQLSINMEARRELRLISEHHLLFDAASYFDDTCHRALQRHAHDVNRETGRLSKTSDRAYREDQRRLARMTLDRYGLRPVEVLNFIATQTDLWQASQERASAGLTTRYRDNLTTSIDLYTLNTKRTFNFVRDQVGTRGGSRIPVLDAVYPDWISEQRKHVEASLRLWILPHLADLPSDLKVGDSDVTDFCTWIEAQGMYQFYWHFRRLLDLRYHSGHESNAANVLETISLASLAEHVANAVMQALGHSPRGHTLMRKLKIIFSATSRVPLEAELHRFRKLVNTQDQSLRRRLATISRIKRGRNAAAIRVLLRLVVIRNEASHFGLSKFEPDDIQVLLRSIVEAALIIWKAK